MAIASRMQRWLFIYQQCSPVFGGNNVIHAWKSSIQRHERAELAQGKYKIRFGLKTATPRSQVKTTSCRREVLQSVHTWFVAWKSTSRKSSVITFKISLHWLVFTLIMILKGPTLFYRKRKDHHYLVFENKDQFFWLEISTNFFYS